MGIARPDLDARLTLRKSSRAKAKHALILGIKSKKWHVGTHGSSTAVRTALGVTGADFESEHPIGFEVYASGQDRKRGTGAQNEKGGLAYLEAESRHAKHPGTGSSRAAGEYRDSQRAILREGEANTVSNSIQYNQLEYAHLPRSIENGPSDEEREIAAVSYETMVRNAESVSFFHNNQQLSFGISQLERAEMLLAFRVRESGKWPTPDEINETLSSVGLKPLIEGD